MQLQAILCIRRRTAAYDFNFSISAIAAAGARTFPSSN